MCRRQQVELEERDDGEEELSSSSGASGSVSAARSMK